ncbi:MAG: lipopolysaccharide core heptosyltransferase RfaQ [Nitrospinaceae bacterium]|nr:MAG: lipopolysaccharide core heptosyltransferase RfaQ [Nitrospinaceae bacterium]
MISFNKEQLPQKPRILLIKLRSIGDVIYNTSVYTPLKQCFPDSHLTVLVERPSYDIVRNHPDVDEVLCFQKGSTWEQMRFYWKLYFNNYDMAIDMHEGTRGAIMCFLTRAPFRVGHKHAKRAFLYNVKLEFSDLNPKFPLDYQVALIKKLGASFDRIAPAVYLSENSRKNARRLLDEKGIRPEDPYCIIHPGTRKIYNQWQYEKFARLADILFSRYGLKIVITCGPGEEDQAQAVIERIDNTPFTFILAELQELAVITEGAEFAVCHNGGYMHLSSVLGTPVIALFGSVHPRVWRPLGAQDVVVYKQVECSPCNHKTRKKECYGGDAECKVIITVEDVLQGVDQILADNLGAKI